MSSFENPGTLPKPGLIGRVLRLILAFILLCFFASVITNYQFWEVIDLRNIFIWMGVIYCFYAFPHAINIGFQLHLGRWPQLIFIITTSLAVVWDISWYGIFPGKAFSLSLVVLVVYVTIHIGISHLLAAFFAVPG